MTVVFADLSGFTEMTGRLGATTTYSVVDEFLRLASATLVSHGALIDKYIGDAGQSSPQSTCWNAQYAQHRSCSWRSIETENLAVEVVMAVGPVPAAGDPSRSDRVLRGWWEACLSSLCS
jgi:class 3 adenylate cyclase